MNIYSKNWNSSFILNSKKYFNNKYDLCLEIGCFEGVTSNYICDNLLTDNGKLICVDPLQDTYLIDNLNDNEIKENETIFSFFKDQYTRFKLNTKLNKHRIELIRKTSLKSFPILKQHYINKIDLIYVDGDHRPNSVYLDAINSFFLLKPITGILIFDDYIWRYDEKNSNISPKLGIDKFLKEYENELNIINISTQVIVKKIIF